MLAQLPFQTINIKYLNSLKVLLALFLAVAAAAPGNVIQVDLNDQNHSQSGDAGNSVSGQYRYVESSMRHSSSAMK